MIGRRYFFVSRPFAARKFGAICVALRLVMRVFRDKVQSHRRESGVAVCKLFRTRKQDVYECHPAPHQWIFDIDRETGRIHWTSQALVRSSAKTRSRTIHYENRTVNVQDPRIERGRSRGILIKNDGKEVESLMGGRPSDAGSVAPWLGRPYREASTEITARSAFTRSTSTAKFPATVCVTAIR